MYKFRPGTAGVYDINVFEPFVHSLPNEEEQHHAMVLLLNLTHLSGYLNDYAGAVALHSHGEELRQQVLSVGQGDVLAFNRSLHMLKLWDEMAGREAAMTVFHFGKSLASIRSAMKRTPTISADTDHNRLREAEKALRQEFPNYELARHAAGHRAEAFSSLGGLKKHAVDGKIFIIGHVDNHEYIATFEGQELRVQLNEAKRQALARATVTIYSAFPKFAEMLPPINEGSIGR